MISKIPHGSVIGGCQPGRVLDWKNAVGADDIRLVVPMTVVNELDKLKND